MIKQKNDLTKLSVFVISTLLILFVSIVFAGEDKGAKEILIKGGKKADVPFPHLKHQEKIEKCSTCHSMFPKTPDSISKLKQSGELKKKKVMNVCMKCHRKMKKSKDKTGPTSCKKCHSG